MTSSPTSKLVHLDMAQNLFSYRILEPISNFLEGLPKVLLNSSLTELDLSSNSFHGSFPIIPPTIQVMAASNNYFTGDIPLTLCKASQLILLDLSYNNISGSIHRCLTNVSVLKLRNNDLTGRLPDIESGLLVLLDLAHNQISGKLPRSLVNCTSLKFLNMEGNNISDTFPFWLKALPKLEVIVLRSNRFHGPISSPERSLSFTALRIMDISLNDFNGSLPPNYFANLSEPLVNSPQGNRWPEYRGDWHYKYPTEPWYYPSIDIKVLTFLAYINISHNRLTGQIPQSTQIGGQSKSSFEGNIDLCGLPLEETCFREATGEPSSTETQKQEEVLNWKAAAVGYGPGVLFGLVIGQAFASYKPALFYKLFRL
ncbi:receptor like protein 54 [Raphanus sativus]|nr:receptor like protein 54 [Raphanus sativus]